MLTAITEITRNASTASRGLKQVSSRLTQVLDDSSATGKKLTEIYDGLGIALKDSEGQIRSTYDILADLAEQWDNLSKNEQEYIALTSAGSNQVQNFTALMENFSVAVEATATAYDSSGSASKENEKAMDTIEKKLQILRSQFEQLVLGEGGLQNAAKWFLDLGVNILKFANSDIGQLIIQLGLLATAFSVVTKAILTFSATNFGASIGLIVTEIGAFIAGASNMTNVITALTISMEACPLFWGALAVTGIILIVKAIDTVTVSLEEQIEKLNEVKSAYEDAKSSVESLESQLESINSKIKEINSQDGAKVAREGELNELNRQKAELESILEIEKERLRIAQLQYEQEAKNTVYKNVVKTETVDSAYGGQEEVSYVAGDRVQILKDNAQAMSEYQQVINDTNPIIEELNNKLDRNGQLSEYEQQQLDGAKSKRDEALNSYNKLSAESNEYATQLKDEISLLSEDSEIRQYAMEGIEAYSNALKESTEAQKDNSQVVTDTDDEYDSYSEKVKTAEEALEELAKSVGLSAGELLEFANALGVSAEKAAEIQSLNNEWNESVDNIQSAYETLTGAIEEYNEQGYYSTDTLQSLLALSPEYLGMIQEEGNQLSLNEEALRNKVIAQAEEAKQIAYNTAITRLNAVASGEATTATEESGNASANAVEKHNNNATAITNKAKANVALAAAEARIRGGGAAEGEVQKILDDLDNELEAIDKWANKVGTSFEGSMGKATKSTNGATSAIKKQSAAIDFIIKQYDKQIDKIKKTKDAAIDSVNKQIKALEKEKDARIKAIDSEIKSLERQKAEREKYWQDQLDKLEKENNERQRNIELQEKQQALALAQQSQVMIMKDGQFVYSQDEGAVSDAEQDLANTQDQNEYERQKELIEELRDTELEWYDERIQALEDYKEQVEEYYEEQIEKLEEYKEYLEEYYEAQIEALEAEKESVNEILEEGATNQQEYWDKMIEQLTSFVEEWNGLVSGLSFPNISGSGISLSTVGSAIKAKSTGDNKVEAHAYASGKGSIGDSEIAVVGENPKYRELVIGSKLNNDQGVVMALKRGSGVVNAGATNTLASIFNALNGQNSNAQQVSNNSSNATNITIGSISLPEVKDGKGFVDYLQNFSADMTQLAFAR